MAILDTSCDVIVLAGRRPGGDALARALGLTDKWLVEIDGKQMLARVLEALEACPRVASVHVVTDVADAALRSNVAQRLQKDGRLSIRPPARSPASSVVAALDAASGQRPCLLTTADHALLDARRVGEFLDLALRADADFVVALADVAALETRFPEVRRTAWRFSDVRVAGCNLFLLATPAARRLLGLWQNVEADRKRPLRILRRFGWWPLLAYLTRRLSLQQAMQRLGTLAGCRVVSVIHPDALVGIDVDTQQDLALVERILAQTTPLDEEASASAASQPSTRD